MDDEIAEAANAPTDALANAPAGKLAGGHGARDEVLARVATSVADRVPFVESVPTALLPPFGTEAVETPRRRWWRRRPQHTHPGRIYFSDWTTKRGANRPVEARLADVAAAVCREIAADPAWLSPMFSSHRIQFRPEVEAAQIAVAAHRLYRARITLGPRPVGAADPALLEAQYRYDQRFDALRDVWYSLVDRAAAAWSYRRHVGEIAPLAAVLAVAGPGGVDADIDVLITQAAANELAAQHLQRLAGELDGAAAQRTLLGLGDDLRELTSAPPESPFAPAADTGGD